MSRSNPTTESQHPCTRWIEWDGSNGNLRYYDKEDKKNVALEDGFTFLLLDQLATVKGWHDRSNSGIYSNEVRDTKSEPLTVKAFKEPSPLAEGLYSQIKDRVAAIGGSYVANCYIAFKSDGELKIGSIQFWGAALNAWVDFRNEHKAELFTKAIQIKGYTEGKKGKIVFRTPLFHLKEISQETNDAASQLDRELQSYLAIYFKKPKTEQTAESSPPQPRRDPDLDPAPEDDLPF
jgi:hypothetical protein